MITKPQLIHILSTTESAHVERTTSTDNMDKFCQAICAFSNDVSGSGKNGYLIIGAHDNGGLSGLKVDDQLLLKISNIRTDGNILPQPVMNVEKFIFDDGDVLVAEVQPSEFPPVRYRGRIWVRVGPRKSVATEAEEKILTERRLSNIHTFDAMPCLGTTTNDLDVKLIEKEYLPKAVAEDVLTEDKRGIEEQLASLGFYDLRYNCPTNGAIVLFGRNPERYLHGSYIQYVRFKGKDRAGDIINEHKFAGNLCRVLPKIDTFIETSIAQKRPIPVSVLREETFSKYPYWATRELLMNAIMHRDYETNAPVQFYEYDDRIEIQNPGGLYGKVTPDNFPNVSDYRNPFIAEAMKVLGYVNRFSRGVYRVQKELMENGNGKAVFDFSLVTAFKVIENISEKYLEEGFGAETTQEKPKKSPRKAQEKPKKSPRKIEEEIVNFIYNKRGHPKFSCG
jgi:ATP-dependent DNA helicase RecG